MKNTPLTNKHIELGAKMAPFAGFNMPVQYTTIQEEHLNVRKNVGVFDVSHMGEFIVRGKEALDLVQYITSNDASRLKIGDVQYSCMPNERGGIVDDLLVYRLTEEYCSKGEKAYMLVVNAGNMRKDWNWVNKHNKFDTEVIDISAKTGLLAVQGPNATKALQSLTDIPLSEIEYYHFRKGKFAGFDNVLVSATGYTGSGGYEIYADVSQISDIWDAVFQAGKKYGIMPAGLGARDTLRLEKGFALYGHEINHLTSPIEAGLGWIVKVDKGDFVGKSFIINKKKKGIKRKLVAFSLEGRRVPRHGYKIFSEDGKEIGFVTSGTFSPSLGHPIGTGYVPKAFRKIGTKLKIKAGSKFLDAVIVKLPFV
ncbi:MAG TPA: glycine cleavage system aminomethyltransferase GcvT [Saprospiraceae bacterium]|nr:glycine cleavage system aminomethyltransferase GcvT [Saprospiraceae bacterium]